MARGRMISKSLGTSERFAALFPAAGDLAEFAQVLFPLLVVNSDDFGRLQGDAFTVKHACYPTSKRSVDEFGSALGYLDGVGLITWYRVDGKQFVQILHFDEHQQGLHKRTRSSFPRPSGNTPESPGQEKRREEKRREQKYPPTPLRGGRRRRRGSNGNGRLDCPHDPRCSTVTACTRRILAEGRKA